MEDNKGILSISQTVAFAEKKYNIKLYHLSPKKIFYINDNEGFCLCAPSSKFHSLAQCYWVDLTLKQKNLLDQYKRGILIFRLEGYKLLVVNWATLLPLLTDVSMQYNSHEQEHWKLYIHKNYLKVAKSNKILKISITSFNNYQEEHNQ